MRQRVKSVQPSPARIAAAARLAHLEPVPLGGATPMAYTGPAFGPMFELDRWLWGMGARFHLIIEDERFTPLLQPGDAVFFRPGNAGAADGALVAYRSRGGLSIAILHLRDGQWWFGALDPDQGGRPADLPNVAAVAVATCACITAGRRREILALARPDQP